MGNMASEIQARIAQDGGAGLAHPDPGVGGVPGNEGGAQPQTPPPAAEPSTTDTGGDQRVPETIPYARFKEVNDRLRELEGFQSLREYGYDPDSLGRLAAFEAQYMSDPIGTWRSMADNLDLPQDVKDAIDQHLAGASVTPGSAEGEPSTPAPAAPELPPDVKERLAYVDQLREREAEAFREQQLQRTVAAWDALDKQDNIEPPTDPQQRAAYDRMRLTAIAAAAGSGQQFRTVDELASVARSTVMGYRDVVLGDAIQRTGRGGSPPPLPGSPPVPAGPVHFKDLKEASRAARAALERGELPNLSGGA